MNHALRRRRCPCSACKPPPRDPVLRHMQATSAALAAALGSSESKSEREVRYAQEAFVRGSIDVEELERRIEDHIGLLHLRFAMP